MLIRILCGNSTWIGKRLLDTCTALSSIRVSCELRLEDCRERMLVAFVPVQLEGDLATTEPCFLVFVSDFFSLCNLLCCTGLQAAAASLQVHNANQLQRTRRADQRWRNRGAMLHSGTFQHGAELSRLRFVAFRRASAAQRPYQKVRFKAAQRLLKLHHHSSACIRFCKSSPIPQDSFACLTHRTVQKAEARFLQIQTCYPSL